MSGINQPISIGTEDPEFYAELLSKISRPTNQRLPFDERSCPDIPGIQNVDGPLAQRLQILLDVVADISPCERGNVSATMACLKEDKGTLETRLYIVFNHEDDKAARSCPQHLQLIFELLREVPHMLPAMDGSPKVIAKEYENDLIKICRSIHNYSFDIFAYRVTKRKDKLLDIREYIEQDRTRFTPQRRSTLMEFLEDVDLIIKTVANAHSTKQLSTTSVQMLLSMYSYWTEHNLLPKDALSDNKATLLDDADAWLAEEHGIGFRLRRWTLKIMSFVISANRLFMLTQSRRLRKLLEGKFVVRLLPSPTTTSYCCDLSSRTIQVALDAALSGTSYRTAAWKETREAFIEKLLKEPQASVVRRQPTVHAELAMIMGMFKNEINYVLPYIGVSKLSCIMCGHYIRTFNEVTGQKIATKGCHGKAHPGWFWPTLPSRDGELRRAFLRHIRQQLVSDFEQYARTRRHSDSSVGSGFPELELGRTRDEYLRLYDTWYAQQSNVNG